MISRNNLQKVRSKLGQEKEDTKGWRLPEAAGISGGEQGLGPHDI